MIALFENMVNGLDVDVGSDFLGFVTWKDNQTQQVNAKKLSESSRKVLVKYYTVTFNILYYMLILKICLFVLKFCCVSARLYFFLKLSNILYSMEMFSIIIY